MTVFRRSMHLVSAVLLAAWVSSALGQASYSEGFDDVGPVMAGQHVTSPSP